MDTEMTEHEKASERVKRGQLRVGYRSPGIPPYGYRWEGRPPKLEPREDEQRVLSIMLELSKAKHSGAEIAEHLNAQGLLPRLAAQLSVQGVLTILQRQRKAGK